MEQTAYIKKVKKSAAKSHTFRDTVRAFIVGGLICVLGQVLIELYGTLGMEQRIASTLASVTLIFLACLTTGIGWFDSLAKFAGAGTLVPITGFANAIVAPAIDCKSEGIITGLSAKLFLIAGPVLVWGVAFSVLYGIVLFVLQCFGVAVQPI